MNDLSLFYGPNAGYVLELYTQYLQDPNSVNPDARTLFATWASPGPAAVPDPDVLVPSPETSSPERFPDGPAASESLLNHAVSAARLARLVRSMGHLAARVDPFGTSPPADPGLELATHGLDAAMLSRLPAGVIGGPLAEDAANALEALGRLRRVYCGSVGYETGHVQDAAERTWLYEAIETGRFFEKPDREAQLDLLERLTEVETFEKYIHTTFQGAKRFSIEGTDTLVPMLDEIIRLAVTLGTREVVLGMAHRGRLNVLAHVLGKAYAALLSGFLDTAHDEPGAVAGKGSHGYSGDVKYHLGYRRTYQKTGVREMPLTLVPNPSHLEFVDPVVEGYARAGQETRDARGVPPRNGRASLAILMHGDAAFPGQGVVAETLNLSRLQGYTTGGTIHIIVNNQIGFTTLPRDARSTLYAGDLAKGFEIPIVHVNADDPLACLAMARLAHAYRETFHKDFLIDLVGYRRFGHNEGDEPAYTQPRMYAQISAHPTVRELWARHLEDAQIITHDELEATTRAALEKLKAARLEATDAAGPAVDELEPQVARTAPETAVPAERLIDLNELLLRRPEGFTPNARLERQIQRRRTALGAEGGIEWGHAEQLAFASILTDGTAIRLTGQDAERGTFSQRHLVLHDPTNGNTYVPLQNLPSAKATFSVYNSPLSENAALGFEYGYSVRARDSLVIWEAQFGDFANSAQVIIDQFIASGKAKWQQPSSLVLLLPHGYEGQGPEHSSARPERFLQMAAEDNMRIVNCTTAAQYFHLLRRQAMLVRSDPRPLIVMSPKSLLRSPLAASSLAELTQGSFRPVLDDTSAFSRRERVTRLILCTGKIYYGLVSAPAHQQTDCVAIARLEELYPFPTEELRTVIGQYENLKEIVWAQEEPRNMGGWNFISARLGELRAHFEGPLLYAGRPEAASPATGLHRWHEREQKELIAAALADVVKLTADDPMERSELTHGR